MLVGLGAHRGQPWRWSALSLIRASPDVDWGVRCEDGGVGTTVLIVDDHPDFRAFARVLLEAGGFEVVGEAYDGASALVAARALKPALVLLDVQLPDIDGFAVCEQLAADERPPVVVLTSSRDASAYRRRLGVSSARGFIAKAELSGPDLAALADAV
jgi:DNA-binding NarL/FixJ family response regulator